MKWRTLLCSALVAALALTGCSTLEEDLCDEECDCEGCSDYMYEDCVNSYDRELRDAEYWGCEDLYDSWLDCRDATWYCDEYHRVFETNCGHERQRLNDCTHR